jgi:outer membrane protein assembly factor BamA
MKIMMRVSRSNSRFSYFTAAALFIVVVSCNYTKNIPKGDALYTGATIKVEDSTITRKEKHHVEELTEHLPRPKPNSKFLGIPIKLGIYNLAGNPEKKGFIRKFLRKFGEPPVLLSSVSLEYNTKVLSNYLENAGYFRAFASGDTVVKRKKAHATYIIEPGSVYTINEVNFDTDSNAVGGAILSTKPKTLLRPNDPFNLEVVKGERSRIDAILKENGYYFFSPDNLIVNADSTIGNNKVNMHLMLKENTPLIARKPYVIDSVFIYSAYRLNATRADTARETVNLYGGYYIVDPRKRFKPKLFPRILRFDSGDVYNRKDHNLSLNRLINLDVFKFVKNRFEISSNSEGDTGRLNTYYYLTPLPRKSLRLELSGNTKSNNYTGSLITLSWRNRNLLKGAEHLDVHANVGSEVQYSGNQSGFNTYRLGGGLTFTTPKFVVPFFKFNTTSAYVPKSRIDLSYDLLNRRKLYSLNSFRAELGYVWKPNLTTQHELNLVSINLVRALNITQIYIDSIKRQPVLKHAVDTQFILGTNYAITFDPLVNDPFGTGLYFNGLADFSGNIAGLVTGANVNKGKQKRIFGTPFSQYIKTQLDFRYYLALNEKMRLANRVIWGFGLPYGNSRELPFIKQFFIGGNNSLRAFRSRSIGPGIYRDSLADNTDFFPDQSGDIKFEFNTELRLKLNNIIEPAIFFDAGNIWLCNNDTLRPGAKFTPSFLNQLAMGAGVGLRLNLTIHLLRLDVAAPLRKPWLPPGERSVFDLRSAVWNLAIGYPF